MYSRFGPATRAHSHQESAPQPLTARPHHLLLRSTHTCCGSVSSRCIPVSHTYSSRIRTRRPVAGTGPVHLPSRPITLFVIACLSQVHADNALLRPSHRTRAAMAHHSIVITALSSLDTPLPCGAAALSEQLRSGTVLAQLRFHSLTQPSTQLRLVLYSLQRTLEHFQPQ